MFDTLLMCLSLFTLNLIGQWNIMRHVHGVRPAHLEFKVMSVLVLFTFTVLVAGAAQQPSGISSNLHIIHQQFQIA
jgi:hypothetical protein